MSKAYKKRHCERSEAIQKVYYSGLKKHVHIAPEDCRAHGCARHAQEQFCLKAQYEHAFLNRYNMAILLDCFVATLLAMTNKLKYCM